MAVGLGGRDAGREGGRGGRRGRGEDLERERAELEGEAGVEAEVGGGEELGARHGGVWE